MMILLVFEKNSIIYSDLLSSPVDYRMEIYIYMFVLAFITLSHVALAFFIVYKNSRALENRMYSYSVFLLVILGVGEMFKLSGTTGDILEVGERISALAYIFWPAFFLYFSLAYARIRYIWNNWLLYLLIFVPSLLLLYMQWTTAIPTNTDAIASLGVSLASNNAILPFLFYFYVYFIVGLTAIYKMYKTAHFERERRQAWYIMWGAGIPAVVGVLADIILFSLGVYTISITMVLTLAHSALIGYAMIHYRFLSLPEIIDADVILAAIKDVVIVIDRDFSIVRVNQSAVELLDYSVKEVSGEPVLNVLKGIKNQDSLLMSGANGFDSAYLYTKDHKKIPVHLMREVIVDNDTGAIMGSVIVARDIRDRSLINTQKEVRLKLRDRVNRLQQFASKSQT